MLKLVPTALASAVLGLTLLVGARPAAAGVTAYTTQAAFTAAATGVTTIDFEGIAPPGSYTYFGNSGTIGGVTFTTGGNLFVVDSGYNPLYNYGTGAVLSPQNAGDLGAALPAGTTAVGSYFNGLLNPSNFTVTLSTGDVFNYNTPAPAYLGGGFAFAGFTTNTGTITSVQFFNNSEPYAAYDNFQYGQAGAAAAVPEPGAVAFGLLSAGSVLGLIARKRKA